MWGDGIGAWGDELMGLEVRNWLLWVSEVG
jgi:hypothetical protein